RERLNPGLALRGQLDLHLDYAALPRQPPPALRLRVELGGPAGVVAEVADAVADHGDGFPPFGERGVLRDVGREQAGRPRRVPALQHRRRDPGGQRLHGRIGAVAEPDPAGPGVRVPAHVAAEPGITAAVADHPPPGWMLTDEQ